jgi:hypothetical protein
MRWILLIVLVLAGCDVKDTKVTTSNPTSRSTTKRAELLGLGDIMCPDGKGGVYYPDALAGCVWYLRDGEAIPVRVVPKFTTSQPVDDRLVAPPISSGARDGAVVR